MSKVQEILEKQRRKEVASQKDPLIPSNPFYDVWTASNLEELQNRYIDFRFRDGMRAAFDYPDRKFVTYVPETNSIHINFSGTIVTIFGKNLTSTLYDLLLERKIFWLREAEHPTQETEADELFIEDILITPEGEQEGEQAAEEGASS